MEVALSYTVKENARIFSLITARKGMWAVKLCSNKNLQFLTGVAR